MEYVLLFGLSIETFVCLFKWVHHFFKVVLDQADVLVYLFLYFRHNLCIWGLYFPSTCDWLSRRLEGLRCLWRFLPTAQCWGIFMFSRLCHKVVQVEVVSEGQLFIFSRRRNHFKFTSTFNADFVLNRFSLLNSSWSVKIRRWLRFLKLTGFRLRFMFFIKNGQILEGRLVIW